MIDKHSIQQKIVVETNLVDFKKGLALSLKSVYSEVVSKKLYAVVSNMGGQHEQNTNDGGQYNSAGL